MEKPSYPEPPAVGREVVEGIPAGDPMNNPQPVVLQAPPAQQSEWSTALCDCFSDIRSSCGCNGSLYLLLCSLGVLPLAAFGVPMSCQWIYSCTYRGKMKQDLGMSPNCCEECCLHFWCEPCSLCQEYRELQNRGYDLSLGWNGNEERLRLERGKVTSIASPSISPSMVR